MRPALRLLGLLQSRGQRFGPLRQPVQQGQHRQGVPNRSLADFIAPAESGLADWPAGRAWLRDPSRAPGTTAHR